MLLSAVQILEPNCKFPSAPLLTAKLQGAQISFVTADLKKNQALDWLTPDKKGEIAGRQTDRIQKIEELFTRLSNRDARG